MKTILSAFFWVSVYRALASLMALKIRRGTARFRRSSAPFGIDIIYYFLFGVAG